MTFREVYGERPKDTYGMALWDSLRAGWMRGQEAMRERCALVCSSMVPECERYSPRSTWAVETAGARIRSLEVQ